MGYMNNDGLLYFWSRLKSIFVRTVNGTAPDVNGNIAVDVPEAATATPLMDASTAAVGTSTKYAREDHKHPVDTSRAASSHSHGNITNSGTLQTTDVIIANGDKLVVTDASNSNKVSRTSVSFDGSTTTQALSKKGTWVNIPQAATANPSMNGTAAVGSSAKFAKEDHVHPSDTSKQDVLTFDDSPTENSNNPVKSGGIQIYVSDMVQNAASDVIDLIPPASATSPLMDGTATAGNAWSFARGNHRHPTDTSRAPLDSPAFTGSPTAPKPDFSANDASIATTNWVRSILADMNIGVQQFRGVINSYSDISNLHYVNKGWYWVVGTAGTYAGKDCEQGDFIYAIKEQLWGETTINGTPYSYGDVNMDGDITAEDANAIERHISGSITLNNNQLILANVDGDGEITTADSAIILRCVTGLINYSVALPTDTFAMVQTNITPMTNSEIDTIVAS